MDQSNNSNLNPQSEVARAAPCHSKEIPLWLVLLDNIPTLALFITGFLIVSIISVAAASVFAIYTVISVVWFWGRICPYCHHYDTKACPCGYGAISSKLFKRKETRYFQKVFKRNIFIVFPNWFIPLGVSIFLLITDYSAYLLTLTVIFSVIGFIIIPAISKLVGCKNCEIKDECPWMTVK